MTIENPTQADRREPDLVLATGDSSAHPEASHPAAEQLDGEQVPRQSWLARLLSDGRAPLVLGGIVLALAAIVTVRHFAPAAGFGRPSIVVFDPVKFINAQRAAASILAVNPSADLTLTMTQVAKQSEGVIREEAHGALVLVKQSVVVPDNLPDITDNVLKRFGLPTTVPTVSMKPSDMSLDALAPTDGAYQAGRYKEDYMLELQSRDKQREAQAAKADAQAKLVP